MSAQFEIIFQHLRNILKKHSRKWQVLKNSPDCYSLGGNAGPAAVQAWRGKVKRAILPLAWTTINKSGVSYHLMGIYCIPQVVAKISPGLKARMTGKTCFNFKTADQALFKELERVTSKAIAGFAKNGFVSSQGLKT